MNRPLSAPAALIAAIVVTACVKYVGPGSSTNPPGPGGSTAGPGASFLAFIKANDVWLISPDGSQTIQLTRDGATEAYTDPTVAPDGTVYALRGEDQMVHMDASGKAIGSPVQLAVLENGGEGLSVAPDGAHLAFVTTGWGTLIDPRFGTPTGSYIYGGTDIITPDGTSVPGAAMGLLLYPSWSNPSTLILGDGVAIYFDTMSADPATWLAVTEGCLIPSDCPSGQEPMAHFARPAVNRSGTILAYEYQPYYGAGGRRMSTIAAAPPAEPTTRCLIDGQENFSDPGSFSADGTLFAFDDTAFDPDTLQTNAGQGIFVMNVDLSAPDCGASSARLVAPGGFQPDFSPATR